MLRPHSFFDAPLHDIDVYEHLYFRRLEVYVHTQLLKLLPLEKLARIDLKALDARGGDGLGPQDEARERFRSTQMGCGLLQRENRRFRARHSQRGLGIQQQLLRRDGIGNIRVVRAALPLAAVGSPAVRLPIRCCVDAHGNPLTLE